MLTVGDVLTCGVACVIGLVYFAGAALWGTAWAEYRFDGCRGVLSLIVSPCYYETVAIALLWPVFVPTAAVLHLEVWALWRNYVIRMRSLVAEHDTSHRRLAHQNDADIEQAMRDFIASGGLRCNSRW